MCMRPYWPFFPTLLSPLPWSPTVSLAHFFKSSWLPHKSPNNLGTLLPQDICTSCFLPGKLFSQCPHGPLCPPLSGLHSNISQWGLTWPHCLKYITRTAHPSRTHTFHILFPCLAWMFHFSLRNYLLSQKSRVGGLFCSLLYFLSVPRAAWPLIGAHQTSAESMNQALFKAQGI